MGKYDFLTDYTAQISSDTGFFDCNNVGYAMGGPLWRDIYGMSAGLRGLSDADRHHCLTMLDAVGVGWERVGAIWQEIDEDVPGPPFEYDPNNVLTKSGSQFSVSGMPTETSYFQYDMGEDGSINGISMDFAIRRDTELTQSGPVISIRATSGIPSEDGAINIALAGAYDYTDPKLKLWVTGGGPTQYWEDATWGVEYYITLHRDADADSVTVFVYSDVARTNLLATLVATGAYGHSYQYVQPLVAGADLEMEAHTHFDVIASYRDWTAFDTCVNDVLNYDQEPIIHLGTYAPWANGQPAGSGWWVPTGAPYWKQWVSDVVAHCDTTWPGKVKYYEMWNEPNWTNFWWNVTLDATGWPANTGEFVSGYCDLLIEGYAGVKQTNPSGQVLAFVVDRCDEGFLMDCYTYLSGKPGYEASGHFFDYVCVHPYCDNRAPDNNTTDYIWDSIFNGTSTAAVINRNFAGMPNMRQIMVDRGDSTKHMMITEFGWRSSPYFVGDTEYVGETLQAQYLARAYDIARTWTWLDCMMWYGFMNVPSEGDPSEEPYSLIHYDWTPKPAYAAYNFASQGGSIVSIMDRENGQGVEIAPPTIVPVTTGSIRTEGTRRVRTKYDNSTVTIPIYIETFSGPLMVDLIADLIAATKTDFDFIFKPDGGSQALTYQGLAFSPDLPPFNWQTWVTTEGFCGLEIPLDFEIYPFGLDTVVDWTEGWSGAQPETHHVLDIPGDTDALSVLTLRPGSSEYANIFAIGRRREYSPNFEGVIDLGSAGSGTYDAGSLGGYFLEVPVSYSSGGPTYQQLLSFDLPIADYRGSYRVFSRCRADLVDGRSLSLQTPASLAEYSAPMGLKGDDVWNWLDLGAITIPEVLVPEWQTDYDFKLSVWVEGGASSGQVDFDFIVVLPTDGGIAFLDTGYGSNASGALLVDSMSRIPGVYLSNNPPVVTFDEPAIVAHPFWPILLSPEGNNIVTITIWRPAIGSEDDQVRAGKFGRSHRPRYLYAR